MLRALPLFLARNSRAEGIVYLEGVRSMGKKADRVRKLGRKILRKVVDESNAEDETPPFVRTLRYTRDVLKGEWFDIGEFTYGCPAVAVHPGRKLKIGKFTSIAQEVTIHLGGNHRTNRGSQYQFIAFPHDWPEARFLGVQEVWGISKGDVVIGNDVWIGWGAQILSGVTIGDGAVIGAGAVVASDVAPYSIVAGNPATPIKKRFDEDTIHRLLELRWWDWPVWRIKENLAIILSDDVERLCRLG